MNPMTNDNSNNDAAKTEAINGSFMLFGYDGLGGSALSDVGGCEGVEILFLTTLVLCSGFKVELSLVHLVSA